MQYGTRASSKETEAGCSLDAVRLPARRNRSDKS